MRAIKGHETATKTIEGRVRIEEGREGGNSKETRRVRDTERDREETNWGEGVD